MMKNLGIDVLKIARKSQLSSLPKIAQKAYKWTIFLRQKLNFSVWTVKLAHLIPKKL